ncbi:MAG: ATP-dependent zinc metalloprotease FtsH [Clostridia bacterium]|nr:ATP-dependent zinc metalloprotease FtsH [Clostridia bacterium]
MKVNVKNIILFLVLIASFIFLAVFLGNRGDSVTELKYGEVIQKFEDNQVTEFVVDSDGVLTITYTDKKVEADTVIDDADTKKATYRLSLNYQIEKILEYAEKEGTQIRKYDVESAEPTAWYIQFLPYIILFVLFIAFWIYMVRQAGKGGKMNSFSRSRAKMGSNDKNPVKFNDVAGADEEKEELQEIVEFLKNPGKFVHIGARIPRGVLLVGPPGTGKTLLAKAVAGEAGVPFFSISGSDFVEMYVGVGASRVRDLFESARKHPASIIFIDEIDAVGRHRGAGLGGGHDEREQTLNQLLVEMDGFGTHEGVIVIAATNRPDILDPALLRPGRFDRQVTVNYPDLKGRVEILRVHVRNKPLEENVDLEKVAQTTVGFTGADLANLLNEAALIAAKRGKHLIGMDEIDEATLKILVGTDKKKKVRSEADTKLTAYHEAGHAILSHLLPGQDPVTRISIIPTSKGAGGYTLTPPEKDRSYEYKTHMEGSIAVFMGGRVAEQLVFDDYTGGASQDIKQATSIARTMVTVYGMSDTLGAVCLSGQHGEEVFLGRDFSASRDYSEATAAQIDAEIRKIVDKGYATAKEILSQNIDKLHFIAQYLIRHEVMDGNQFRAAMDQNASEEELVAMAEERDRKSREENRIAAEKAAARERRFEEERDRLTREALGMPVEVVDDADSSDELPH